MARAVDFSSGIGRKELRLVQRRFRGLQRERLRRIAEELTPRQQDYLNLLPLLCHINHPALPGFSGSEAPAGIPDFSPSKKILRVARKFSSSFSYKKRALRRYPIQGVYLMGSIGSIAHSSGSDLDVWLCYDSILSNEQVVALRHKADALEAWGNELSLEVHIFVMDPVAFRSGDREALSRESSGSTQRHLLLEEFYRTGILLAGRYPIWWLVPPEEEGNYTKYVEMLLRKRFVDGRDCIDFGGLDGDTPADEFFGAAHWQLYKGIESPYKAMLKLLLIEAYSRDYPSIRWLCQSTKEALYSGNLSVDELDPYLLLYRRVEQYLSDRGQPERLELARRCFYFKSEQRLSLPNRKKEEPWQRELLSALTEEWGWDRAALILQDSRRRWKIDRVLQERATLVRELTNGYRVLTEFSRAYAASGQIDPEELNLLGRKLYTAMERQPGKIDSINPGISDDLAEPYVSLHFQHNTSGEECWLLFRGEVNIDAAAKDSPVKTTNSLIEMLCWIHLNGIVGRGTVVALFPEDVPVGPGEIHSLLNALRHHYPFGQQRHIGMQALSQPAYAIHCTLFVNTGIDPMAHLSKAGKQLTSDRSNPLSFGSAHICLIESVEALLVTSWGEVLITRHLGADGLAEYLCRYLQMTLGNRPDEEAPEVEAYGFSSIRATTIARRAAQLCNDMCRSFGPDGAGLDSRYVYQVGDSYYLIERAAKEFVASSASSKGRLTQMLGQAVNRFRPLVIDGDTLQDTLLPTIYEYNQEGEIQLFYHCNQGNIALYILDEYGVLFQQNITGSSESQMLDQQQLFFNALVMLRSLRSEQYDQQQLLEQPEYYRVMRGRDGLWKINRRALQQRRIGEEYLDLCLISEGLDLEDRPYMLMCGNREFISLEYGAETFHEVARYVYNQRDVGETYPIYLTSLELSGTAPQQGWSTIELLNFKKRVETRFNQALADILAE